MCSQRSMLFNIFHLIDSLSLTCLYYIDVNNIELCINYILYLINAKTMYFIFTFIMHNLYKLKEFVDIFAKKLIHFCECSHFEYWTRRTKENIKVNMPCNMTRSLTFFIVFYK